MSKFPSHSTENLSSPSLCSGESLNFSVNSFGHSSTDENMNFPSQATNAPESRNYMFSTNLNKNISSPQRLQFSGVGDAIKLSTGDHKEEVKISMKAPETLNLDISSFQEKLLGNNGIIIFKFGASWCKPCKTTEPYFNNFYNYLTLNENLHKKIECINIDVDDSFELYATMKRYRMVKGLPTFLAYYKNNNTYITDDSSIGSDINQLNSFFIRCLNKINDF
jgi:thiol-disulfide isomerase/thioredoxin